MSKFFITNNKSLYRDIKKQVELSPFDICFSKEDKISCLTTKKLMVDHKNAKEEGNGFVAITGTMVWGDGLRVDDTVLNEIWNTYKGDINEIRKACIGNYAVSIVDNDNGCVFSDLSGFYNIYYYSKNGIWIISNSLYDLYLVLKKELTLDKFSVIEFMRQSSILNGDSQFNEIKRLRGFDYLRFKSDKLECIIDNIKYPHAQGNLKEQVSKYVDFSKDYAAKTYNAFGIPTISMTGGLDARMLLSSYLSIGVKPDIYYGKGNSFLTNTYNQDLNIDRIYRDRFGLQLYESSWATPDPMDQFWDKYLDYFGFSYDIYSSSDAVMESVLNNPNIYFILGEGGEMLRNLPWVDNRNTDYFTLEEFINEYYAPQELADSIVDKNDFLNHIRKKCLDICNYYQINPEHIATEDVFFLTLEHRKTADSQTLNWMNLIRYDSIQMIEYDGLLQTRLGYKDTSNAKFMLHCQNLMYPDVLDVPFFSRCKMRTFDRQTMSLKPMSSIVQNLKEKTRQSMPFLFSFVRKYFYRDAIQRNPINEKVYNRALELYDIFNKQELFNLEKFTDKRYLIKYVMFLYAINKNKKN